MRRWAAVIALVVVGVGLLEAGAVGRLSRGSAADRALARADAASELAMLSLPAGAERVKADPSVSSRLSNAFVVDSQFRNVADVGGFWRVPGTPSAVLSWVRANQPTGSRLKGSGRAPGERGVLYAWFSFTPLRGRVIQRWLVVMITAATGGGSAVRADGSASWLLIRPAWEHVPRSARVVTASYSLSGDLPSSFAPRTSAPRTFISRSLVRTVARVLDRFPVVQPERPISLTPPAFYGVLRLSFRERPDGSPIARVTAYTSDYGAEMSMSVHGRRGVDLGGGWRVVALVLRRGLLPDCTPGELQVQSQGPFHLARSFELDLFVNAHTPHPCLLASHPQVELLAAADRLVPTRGRYPWSSARPISPVGVEYSLLWKRNCPQRAARAVVLSILRHATPVVHYIPAQSTPFAPCRGTVKVNVLAN